MSAIKLKRFGLIIEKIKYSKFPSLAEIETHLRKSDVVVSERTLQRDIEQIRRDCDVLIEYDSLQRGYFIEENAFSANKTQFLEMQSLHTNFLEFIKENPKNSDAILIDNNTQSKGIEYIEQILFAISKKRQIEISYQKFESEIVKQYIIEPYSLKEFQQRWYLVGTTKNYDTLLKFGLDRITELKVSTQKFTKQKNINVKEHFDNMIGIHSESENKEIVQLCFNKYQANYIKTVPLHWSQKIVSETNKEMVFEYFLIVNYELIQKILSFGDQVKVLQPKSLITTIKRITKNTLQQYK